MDKEIEECARLVLSLLKLRPEVNILRIPELLEDRSVITYEAVGWLAREGKISTTRKGGQVYVSLYSGENEASQEATL